MSNGNHKRKRRKIQAKYGGFTEKQRSTVQDDLRQPTPLQNTVNTSAESRSLNLPKQAKPLLKRFSSWLLAGVALVASIATLWQMRPILSASASYSPNYPGPFPTLFAVTNNGQLPVYDIEASSYPALITFSEGDAIRFYSHINSYSLISSQLTSGESGTSPIGQMIRMFKSPEKIVIMIGDLSGQQSQPTFIVHLHTRESQSSRTLFGQEGRLQLVGTNEESISFADLVAHVKYKPWFLPQVETKFRFLGERNNQNVFSWYAVALTQKVDLKRISGDLVELSDESLPDNGNPQFQFRTP